MNWSSIPLISFLILAAILAVKIIILKKKGVKTGSANGEKNKAKRIVLPIFLLVFLLWLFELVKPAFNIEFSLLPLRVSDLFKDCEKLQLVGAVLLLFSLFFFGLTLIGFGNSLRFGLDENNQGTLITTGIFSLSRNPFFLSLDLFLVGVAMILPSFFHIIFTLAAIIGIHIFILKEERFLEKHYGEKYLEYKQRTRRYL